MHVLNLDDNPQLLKVPHGSWQVVGSKDPDPLAKGPVRLGLFMQTPCARDMLGVIRETV